MRLWCCLPSSSNEEDMPESGESSYRRSDSTISLISRGSGNLGGHIRGSETGIYISSCGVTVLTAIFVTITVLTLALLLTFYDIASSCTKNPIADSSLSSKTPNRCASFLLNAEMNNVRGWLLPDECESYVKDYMNGGQYLMDVELAANASKAYFRTLNGNSDGKEAVVFDIDETLVSNLPYYVDHRYGVEAFNMTSWNTWEQQCEAPALLAMLSLYKEIQAANFSVVLLTGRDETHRACTEKNLLAAGYTGWTYLYLREKHEQGMTALSYKSGRRQGLEKEGYRIVSSFGDQWSDIQGPAIGNRTFKIPNPMYYIG